MKVIPKFQRGGEFDSIFTVWQPIQSEHRRQTINKESSSSKQRDDNDDTKGKLTEKDLFTLLKEVKGLPNETQALFASFQNALQLARDTGRDGLNDIATLYMNTVSKLNNLEFNKEQFKNTYNRAVVNGSLNDIAITTTGEVVVTDNESGRVTTLSPQEWQQVKGSGKYSAMTNSNLLWLRYKDPTYVDNNRIFQIIENGISLDQVSKLIREQISTLGHTDMSTQSYLSPQERQAIQGAKEIQELIAQGPDAVYKLKETSTNSDTQISAAVSYIYNMLPNNAKARLSFMIADSDNIGSIKDVILNMLLSRASYKYNQEASFDSSATKASGKTGADGEKTKYGMWTQIYHGEGGINAPITIMEGDTAYGALTNGKYYSALPSSEKGPTSLSNFLLNSGLQYYTQSIKGITFGEMPLKPQDLNNIMYDNSGGYVATLPAREDNGIKVVNLSIMKDYEQIIQNLKNRGIVEGQSGFDQALAQELENYGYGAMVTSEGLPDPKYFGKFLVIQGYSSSAFGNFEDSYKKFKKNDDIVNSIQKIKGNSDPQLANEIDSILGQGTVDRSWIIGDNDIYKAAVFIPLSLNATDAANADSVKLTRGQSHQNEVDLQYFEKNQKLNSTKTPDDLQ